MDPVEDVDAPAGKRKLGEIKRSRDRGSSIDSDESRSSRERIMSKARGAQRTTVPILTPSKSSGWRNLLPRDLEDLSGEGPVLDSVDPIANPPRRDNLTPLPPSKNHDISAPSSTRRRPPTPHHTGGLCTPPPPARPTTSRSTGGRPTARRTGGRPTARRTGSPVGKRKRVEEGSPELGSGYGLPRQRTRVEEGSPELGVTPELGSGYGLPRQRMRVEEVSPELGVTPARVDGDLRREEETAEDGLSDDSDDQANLLPARHTGFPLRTEESGLGLDLDGDGEKESEEEEYEDMTPTRPMSSHNNSDAEDELLEDTPRQSVRIKVKLPSAPSQSQPRFIPAALSPGLGGPPRLPRQQTPSPPFPGMPSGASDATAGSAAGGMSARRTGSVEPRRPRPRALPSEFLDTGSLAAAGEMSARRTGSVEPRRPRQRALSPVFPDTTNVAVAREMSGRRTGSVEPRRPRQFTLSPAFPDTPSGGSVAGGSVVGETGTPMRHRSPRNTNLLAEFSDRRLVGDRMDDVDGGEGSPPSADVDRDRSTARVGNEPVGTNGTGFRGVGLKEEDEEVLPGNDRFAVPRPVRRQRKGLNRVQSEELGSARSQSVKLGTLHGNANEPQRKQPSIIIDLTDDDACPAFTSRTQRTQRQSYPNSSASRTKRPSAAPDPLAPAREPIFIDLTDEQTIRPATSVRLNEKPDAIATSTNTTIEGNAGTSNTPFQEPDPSIPSHPVKSEDYSAASDAVPQQPETISSQRIKAEDNTDFLSEQEQVPATSSERIKTEENDAAFNSDSEELEANVPSHRIKTEDYAPVANGIPKQQPPSPPLVPPDGIESESNVAALGFVSMNLESEEPDVTNSDSDENDESDDSAEPGSPSLRAGVRMRPKFQTPSPPHKRRRVAESEAAKLHCEETSRLLEAFRKKAPTRDSTSPERSPDLGETNDMAGGSESAEGVDSVAPARRVAATTPSKMGNASDSVQTSRFDDSRRRATILGPIAEEKSEAHPERAPWRQGDVLAGSKADNEDLDKGFQTSDDKALYGVEAVPGTTTQAKRKRAQRLNEDNDEDQNGEFTGVPWQENEGSLGPVPLRPTISATDTPASRSLDDDTEEEIDSDKDEMDNDIVKPVKKQSVKEKRAMPEDCGTIESIELVNFMCHAHFKVQFNSHINFITGHNGSGKSAILTALTLCLGGKANFTNRASSIKDLVMEGTSTGYITVILKNEGPEAFSPELYGKRIIIERRFNTENRGGYKILNQNFNVVADTKDELTAVCDHMSITIDNHPRYIEAVSS
ncbi:Structural maintenance of chromosomes protein 6 [Phlyctochytrium bullatum]|nr:Structural maintenance of chromosomes protein 6 [Phlyctochytrium bullatum]